MFIELSFRTSIKRIISLIIFTVGAFAVISATTYGWRFWRRASGSIREDKDIMLAGRLEKHVYKLSHEIGDRSVFEYHNLQKAAEYIAGQLSSFGYSVRFQSYDVLNKKVGNIIAEKKGSQKPCEVIIVGAHYDTCFNPGADDNASGVAGVIELAREFSKRDTKHTIRFVAFVNEEPPFLKTGDMGSVVYAKELKKKGDVIKGAVILEMIGYYTEKTFSQRYPPLLGAVYPNKGNFICLAGNFPSRKLLNKVVSGFRKGTSFPVESITLGFAPGADLSDHWSFWEEKYPAVMFTDTAFFRYPHYHKDSDIWEKLDYEKMSYVVKGVASALRELAE
ncbi:MAG: aminopeptidase [Elusimicrobia bacterium HGW-Elusimicrobia-1]|jgi:Zn-dependent M28 family amino/carboxypeptidase|nr:MAG: aminopeptidase [Elusimicrobia bacterium HGW-Elusimicrobia-1]